MAQGSWPFVAWWFWLRVSHKVAINLPGQLGFWSHPKAQLGVEESACRLTRGIVGKSCSFFPTGLSTGPSPSRPIAFGARVKERAREGTQDRIYALFIISSWKCHPVTSAIFYSWKEVNKFRLHWRGQDPTRAWTSEGSDRWEPFQRWSQECPLDIYRPSKLRPAVL